MFVEDFLEVMMRDAEHHVGVHGDEAPVAVIGETPIARFLRQRRDRRVVEAEIEHRIHHARHRRARAGAHRDEQRIFAVAKCFAGDAANFGQRRFDLRLQILRIVFAVGVEMRAELGGDGEAGRHRQAEMRHFGKARAFAAKEIAHIGAAGRLAAAEGVNPFPLLPDATVLACRGFRRRTRLGFLYRLTAVFGARFGHGVSFA